MHEKEVYFQKSNKQLQLVSHALKLSNPITKTSQAYILLMLNFCKLRTQLPSKIKILLNMNTLIDTSFMRSFSHMLHIITHAQAKMHGGGQ